MLSPESTLSRRGLGSLEVALLGLACAVFFGGLIAVVTVCSLRYRRGGGARSSKYPPAPLAIPLGPGSGATTAVGGGRHPGTPGARRFPPQTLIASAGPGWLERSRL